VKERSKSWKRAVFMHSIAWPMTVTSTVLFSVFLREEQVCQTYFDFGFDQWRKYVVLIASYFPMFALLIDLMISRVVLSYKHIVPAIFILALYFLITFLGSLVQSRPIYAKHLAYFYNYDNDYATKKE
jgi:hypothetical protein